MCREWSHQFPHREKMVLREGPEKEAELTIILMTTKLNRQLLEFGHI